LRKTLVHEGQNHAIDVFFPNLSLCMDNAAMVAGLGFHNKSIKNGRGNPWVPSCAK